MLNNKLKAISSLIPSNVKVIDVGCDHALLDIYLTRNNDNKCIAADINENALNIAKNNISKYNLEDKIETVLTDGIENINISKEDYVVIAGMGTHTILKIIKNKDINNLILSSNNKLEHLRKEIIKKYTIVNEILVKDRHKYYIIFDIKKGKQKLTKKQLFLGINNFDDKEYYTLLHKKYSVMLDKIPKSKFVYRMNIKSKIKYIESVK